MKTQWSAYRITLLLYLGLILIPLSFYTSFSLFKEIKSDIQIQYDFYKSNSNLLVMSEIESEKRNQTLNELHQALAELKPWFQDPTNESYYVGGQSLAKDFENVLFSLDQLKEAMENQKPYQDLHEQYWKGQNNLAFAIDKIITLKQSKLENYFYIALAVSLFFLLLLIYLVRAFVAYQLHQHAIHDEETNLFNKKYFLTETDLLIAKSIRYKQPLSLLWVSMEFDQNISDNNKKRAFQEFGRSLLDTIRCSDVAARYTDPSDKAAKTLFAILLPMTERDYANVLVERLQDELGKNQFLNESEIEYHIDEFDPNETNETLLKRGIDALS